MKPVDHMEECPCPECQRRRAAVAFSNLLILVAIAAIILGCLFGPGCTVVPTAVHATQASFDGNEQNSGILAVAPSGYFVTRHFRDRYNALVDDYGSSFQPKLSYDDGVTLTHLLTDPPQELWAIDREHMVKFIEMNTWRKSGRSPNK